MIDGDYCNVDDIDFQFLVQYLGDDIFNPNRDTD